MRVIVMAFLAFCAGCAEFAVPVGPQPVDEAALVPEPDEAAPEAPPATAAAPAETLATLGNAAEPGLWLRTPLVDRQGPGRITAVETGTSLDVTLIPIDGARTAGSRASLAALQGLGVPLTAVVPIRVTPL